MAPNWMPMCKCMQLYCEPYFSAIDNWREYEDEALLMNRIQLVETACHLFHTYSQNPDVYTFGLQTENEDVILLPEVQPIAGKEFKVGGDKLAFENAKRSRPPDLFNKSGVFFQDNLLKSMAGWNEEILKVSNLVTRKTIIQAVEKLLRLPESAGKAHFNYSLLNVEEPYLKPPPIDHPPISLSPKGLQFYNYLLESKHLPRSVVTAGNKNNRNGRTKASAAKKSTPSAGQQDDIDQEWEADDDGVMWTSIHPTVNTRVAAYFPPIESLGNIVSGESGTTGNLLAESSSSNQGIQSKVFKGTVVRYARPTKKEANDQLYHIQWEDGDEQDFDEMDLQKGIELFDKLEGWTSRHPTVGKKIAAHFPNHLASGKVNPEQPWVIYQGTVTKYGAPQESDEEPLYHIVWEDGDEQDYNDDELQAGVQLYNSLHNKDSSNKANTSKTNSKSVVSSKQTQSSTTAAATKGSSSSSKKRGRSSKDEPAVVASTTTMSSGSKRLRKANSDIEEEEDGNENTTVAVDDNVVTTSKKTDNEQDRNNSNNNSSSSRVSPRKRDRHHEDNSVLSSRNRSTSSRRNNNIDNHDGDDDAEITFEDNSHSNSKRKINENVVSNKAQSNNKSKPNKSVTPVEKEEEEVEVDDEEPMWTIQHDSVGIRVAAYFLNPDADISLSTVATGTARKGGGLNITSKGGKKYQAYGGTVTQYAPPSAPGAGDQLYHIRWDDGDEEDYDEDDLQRGLKLLESMMPTHLLLPPNSSVNYNAVHAAAFAAANPNSIANASNVAAATATEATTIAHKPDTAGSIGKLMDQSTTNAADNITANNTDLEVCEAAAACLDNDIVNIQAAIIADVDNENESGSGQITSKKNNDVDCNSQNHRQLMDLVNEEGVI